MSLGVGVPEDFVPTTAMERAFVQARTWAAERAWKRAYTEMAEGQLAEVYVAQGRFFEATVLIYEAYSNIPDNECGGAQQILMSY